MATINVHANIKEINRYQFEVEVDDNLTEQQQDEQAKAKVAAFLDKIIPYPFQSEPVDGVRCVDVENGISQEEVMSIDVNNK